MNSEAIGKAEALRFVLDLAHEDISHFYEAQYEDRTAGLEGVDTVGRDGD